MATHKKFFIVTVALFVLTLTFLVGTLFSAEKVATREVVVQY